MAVDLFEMKTYTKSITVLSIEYRKRFVSCCTKLFVVLAAQTHEDVKQQLTDGDRYCTNVHCDV
jgi:hypothetical protein